MAKSWAGVKHEMFGSAVRSSHFRSQLSQLPKSGRHANEDGRLAAICRIRYALSWWSRTGGSQVCRGAYPSRRNQCSV